MQEQQVSKMQQTKANPESNRSKKKAAAEAHNEAMRKNAVEGTDRPNDEERAELDRLSSKVFGIFNPQKGTFSPGPSSRWQSLLKKGTLEALTDEINEYVPEIKDEEGNVTQKEDTVKHLEYRKYISKEGRVTSLNHSVIKRFTVQSLILELLEREKAHDQFVALLEKNRKEQEEKRKEALLADQVQNAAGGSTL